MSFASGALSAKAKAMYGRRITHADYQALIQKKSVGDVAGYLKHQTYYSGILTGVNEASIHRGQLEMLLRYDWFNRFSALLRYGNERSHFYHYIIGHNEIEQIMACLHMIEHGDQLELVSKMPTHLAHYMSFDLFALAKVKDYDELLTIVEHTPYYSILKAAKPRYMSEFDYVGVESQLTRVYYDDLIKTIHSLFSGEKREKIEQMFTVQIELNNIIKIYRLKKYYNASPSTIRDVVTPHYGFFSKETINRMIDADNADDVLDQLRNSRYKNYVSNQQFMYIEYQAKAINYAMNRQSMNFSTDPDFVLMSYMVLSETEVDNLVNIIEGIRYHIAPDKIASLLIE